MEDVVRYPKDGPQGQRVYPALNHSKVPVCRRAGYTIYFEQLDNYTLIHADFHSPLTAQLFRAYKRDTDVLFAMHGGPVHCITAHPHNGDYRKWEKFVRACGFDFNCMVPCWDGVSRPWFTRRT